MPAQKRQPRLKESCDACSTAKVRCTKDKPNCSRCQQKGLSCEYSFSRRAGRKTTASLVTKADRRPASPSSRASSPIPFCNTPSASSSLDQSPQLDHHHQLPHNLTPTSSDSDSSDVFQDMWSSAPTYTTNNPFSWDLQNSLLNQYTFPLDHATTTQPPTDVLPTPFDPMDMTLGGAPTAPMMARNFSTATDLTNMSDLTLASDISSTSSAASSMCEAVHDELSNLTTFAESMERKFDAVVRARLQYRDVYSEFGVPVDEIEGHGHHSSSSSTSTSVAGVGGSPVDRILGQGGVQAGKGGVPSPDVNELAFYYSLAELKRRLKWVKEDVGNLMGGTTAAGMAC
ncbi:hypothetical protein M409DRAFT_17873 [Zasmidium cellare ATCC 36951]|uniref:Zn(2)-C6 fungal-type domain-containing protein n=1 Tax=Zasmidium cellare ATCC 36951 TaxID=1080233 RepID=A0A6A6D1Y7_ZASCE|nr:uncharacterized protein M409DRAFT_17873 [Zasmidium cellare ATCC 36951]KAF2171636.1 hypothetical protein M409DRAFT_17873 [Zasmidium cellare ATCC 36951]